MIGIYVVCYSRSINFSIFDQIYPWVRLEDEDGLRNFGNYDIITALLLLAMGVGL